MEEWVSIGIHLTHERSMGRDELTQSLPCKAEENQVKTKDDIQSIFYNMAGLIGGKGIGIQGFSSKALHNTIVPLPLYITPIDRLTEQMKY